MFANSSMNDNLTTAAFLTNNMNSNNLLNNNMMHLDNNQVNNHLTVNYIYQNQLNNEHLQNQNQKNYQLNNIIRNLNQTNLPTNHHLYTNLNKLQLNQNNLINNYQNLQQQQQQQNYQHQNGQQQHQQNLNQQFEFLNQQQQLNNLSPLPHLLNNNLNNASNINLTNGNLTNNHQLPLQPKQLPQHNIPNVFCNLKNQTPIKYQNQLYNNINNNTPSNLNSTTFHTPHQSHKQQNSEQLNQNNHIFNSIQNSNLQNFQQQQLQLYLQQQLNNQNNPNILNRNLISTTTNPNQQHLINRNLFNVNSQTMHNQDATNSNYFNSILNCQNLNNLNTNNQSTFSNKSSFINNLISTPNRNLDYNSNNNNSSFTFNSNGSGGSLSNKSNSSSDCLTSSTHSSTNENVIISGQLKNFKIIKEIGNGQFSVVYRAVYIPTGQYVALKCIRILELEDMKTRLDCINEISLLQRLDHPNIVKFYTSFVECNELYIVLELADCGDLAQLIKHFRKIKKTIPERRIWGYFRQVANGLLHMHENCVLHRDIKPPNVFITQSGVVKLGDLGLSKYYGASCKGDCCCKGPGFCLSNKEKNNNLVDTRAVLESHFNTLLSQKNINKNNQQSSASLGNLVKACTQQVRNNISDHKATHYKLHRHLMQDEASSLIGTPFYMSKERLSENCKYDSQSDIWSLGCILYEMAALQSPFYGEKLNLISLCQKIVSCNYPPLVNNYSVTLRALVASCLDSDPKKRPEIHSICEIAKMCSELSQKELQVVHLYSPAIKLLKVDEIVNSDKSNNLSPTKSNNIYSNMNGMSKRSNKHQQFNENNLNSMTTTNNNILNHNNLNHICIPNNNQLIVTTDNQKNFNHVVNNNNNNFFNNMTNDCNSQYSNDLHSLENSSSFLKFWSNDPDTNDGKFT